MHTLLLFLVFIQIEELNSEIKELSAAFAKAREASQKAQTQKFQVSIGCLCDPGEGFVVEGNQGEL